MAFPMYGTIRALYVLMSCNVSGRELLTADGTTGMTIFKPVIAYRICFYSMFKASNVVEPYLLMNINRFVKCTWTKLRFGISAIALHSQRYSRSPSANDLMCHLCKSACEDEVRCVLCCPALEDLRRVFIRPKYYYYPSTFKLTLLRSTKNENTLRNLALYLYTSFKRLNVAIKR